VCVKRVYRFVRSAQLQQLLSSIGHVSACSMSHAIRVQEHEMWFDVIRIEKVALDVHASRALSALQCIMIFRRLL
jgi:hypothetical protein